MPEVHFIGAIDHVSGVSCDDELCLTWALVPGMYVTEWLYWNGTGCQINCALQYTNVCFLLCVFSGNEEWYIQKGSFFGETQISSVAVSVSCSHACILDFVPCASRHLMNACVCVYVCMCVGGRKGRA
jgi:hypothetical protein